MIERKCIMTVIVEYFNKLGEKKSQEITASSIELVKAKLIEIDKLFEKIVLLTPITLEL